MVYVRTYMSYTEQSSIFFISEAELLAYVLCINANLNDSRHNCFLSQEARTNRSTRHIAYGMYLHTVICYISVIILITRASTQASIHKMLL